MAKGYSNLHPSLLWWLHPLYRTRISTLVNPNLWPVFPTFLLSLITIRQFLEGPSCLPLWKAKGRKESIVWFLSQLDYIESAPLLALVQTNLILHIPQWCCTHYHYHSNKDTAHTLPGNWSGGYPHPTIVTLCEGVVEWTICWLFESVALFSKKNVV